MRMEICATAPTTSQPEPSMQTMLYRIAATLLMTAGCASTVYAGPDTRRPAAGSQTVADKVHVAGPCRFKISPMFGGEFEDRPPGDSPPQGFYHMPDSGPGHSPVLYGGFPLYCIDARDAELIDTLLGAKQFRGQWRQANMDDTWVPFDPQQQFDVIEFKGRNWTERGTLISDTTDDESKRARWFRFCLIHDQVALCGKSRVKSINRPDIDELPKVKAILESIEFVDYVAPTPDNTDRPATPLRKVDR